MARNRQLRQLVELFRVETGSNPRLEAGVDGTESHKRLLARWQETLAELHDWPFLNFRPLIALQTRGRFYDLPTGVSLESVQDIVYVKDGKVSDVVRGIGPEDYNAKDPITPDTADPVKKWDVQWTGSKEQIEVWPVPNSPGFLQLFCKRDLRPLVSESDVADLDDQLIVLHAAADYLQSKNDSSWEAKSRQAARRLANLTSKSRVDSPNVNTVSRRGPPTSYPRLWGDEDDYDQDDLYTSAAP